ncbi:hypothetical protein QQP08_004118, partial [Theobroma cacao]
MSNVCSFTESIILAQSSCGRHSIVQLSCDLGINLLQDSATLQALSLFIPLQDRFTDNLLVESSKSK